jgi:hypothetical protein
MANTQGGVFNPTDDITFSGAVTFTNATSQSGTLVTTTGVQTLTNKNLTAPTITGAIAGTPSIAGLTTTGAILSQKIMAYSADGAIAVESGVAIITKAGVGAMTLALPTATTHDGLTLIITTSTANAHVITCTNGFNAGETGAPFNKVTLAAFPGSSATLVAYQALWYVVSDQVATVGD